MICKQCKREIPDGSKSCCFCGEKYAFGEKKWVCPKCNFLNQNSHFDCNGCGAEKPSNPKYVEVERADTNYIPWQKSEAEVLAEKKRNRIFGSFLSIACVLTIIQSIYFLIISFVEFRFVGIAGIAFPLVFLGFSLLRNKGGTVVKIVVETLIMLVAVGDGLDSGIDIIFALLIPVVVITCLFIGWRATD